MRSKNVKVSLPLIQLVSRCYDSIVERIGVYGWDVTIEYTLTKKLMLDSQIFPMNI